MNCMNCGSNLPVNAKYCPECGVPVANTGSELLPDDNNTPPGASDTRDAAETPVVYTPGYYSQAEYKPEEYYSASYSGDRAASLASPPSTGGTLPRSEKVYHAREVPEYAFSPADTKTRKTVYRSGSPAFYFTLLVFSLAGLLVGINIFLTVFHGNPFLFTWPVKYQFAFLMIFVVLDAATLVLYSICKSE